MINLILNIIAIWLGVLGEVFFGELLGISLFVVVFIFLYEKIDLRRILILGTLVSLILDVVGFLPIGSHMLIVGVSYLVYVWIGKILEGNSGIVSILNAIVAFTVYYLLMNVVVLWSEGISVQSLGLIDWGEVIMSSLISSVIFLILRMSTDSIVTPSQTIIKIRT